MSFSGKYPPLGSGGGGSGTVTSIDVSGGTTGLTTSGGPVTTAGTITISGVLGTSNGGTGQTSTGSLTDVGTDGIVVTGGTGSTITNVSIAQHVADTSHNGYLSSTDWNTFNGKGPGSVTSVSVTSANGVSGTVATATTTPAITLALGAITPTSVAATGTVGGSNLSGTNTGDLTLNTAGSTANASGATLTGQALTLQTFSSSFPGIVGGSGGGTTNYLRADGSWAAPPGATSGTVTSVSSSGATGLTLTTTNPTTTPALALGGTLTIAGGGTGQTAKAAAFDALQPMTTGGDLIYGGASGTGTRLANGSAGQVLSSAGSTSAPTWATTTALTTVYQTSSTTAVNLTRYLCNTTSAAFTMTLPNGSSGATIMFLDDANTWATNNLTIAPAAAQTIQGISSSGSLVCNLSGAWVELAWDTTNSYWVVAASGFQYGPTYSPGVTGGILPSTGLPASTTGTPTASGFVGNINSFGSQRSGTGGYTYSFRNTTAATSSFSTVISTTLAIGNYLVSGYVSCSSSATTFLSAAIEVGATQVTGTPGVGIASGVSGTVSFCVPISITTASTSVGIQAVVGSGTPASVANELFIMQLP